MGNMGKSGNVNVEWERMGENGVMTSIRLYKLIFQYCVKNLLLKIIYSAHVV
jgi:hypothetical protein